MTTITIPGTTQVGIPTAIIITITATIAIDITDIVTVNIVHTDTHADIIEKGRIDISVTLETGLIVINDTVTDMVLTSICQPTDNDPSIVTGRIVTGPIVVARTAINTQGEIQRQRRTIIISAA